MIRAVRGALVAFGLVLAGVGFWSLTGALHHPRQWVGLAIWLIAAVVLHDGILVPGLTILAVLLARVGRTVPGAALAIVKVGFLVGALLTATTGPELVAQARGPRNPTVVPQNYAMHLALIWAAIVGLVAIGVWISVRRGRQTPDRPAPIDP